MKFAQPAWLILLVLLPLLGAAAVAVARLRRRQWAAFVAPRLRSALLKRGSPLPRWFALFFLLAACAALIIAMARPQGDAGTRTEKSLGRNVLIALDLSRSMRVADIKPDRLTRAKMTVYELLEAMPNERVGIIGFAGSAYVYAPLTVDHQAVRETVEQIDENWATQGGSNLGAAVSLAIETLKKTGQKNNALVILSDGEKHDGNLDDIIDQARESGVYILAIGVGTEDGDYVPSADFPGGRMVDRSGKTIISRLQPEVLQALASGTKGRYALAASGADIAAIVRDVVKDLDAFEIEGRERAISIEFYQWLVFPAMAFLLASILAATRWRGIHPALVLAGFFLTPSLTRGDEVSSARQQLLDGKFNEARTAYQKLAESTRLDERRACFRLGEATAAYGTGDFRGAREAFSGALFSEDPQVLESGHCGMGKSLFQLGWQSLAGKPYPDDPQSAPQLADFDALVRKKLEAMRDGEDFRMENLITNWADAVRHFESALAAVPASPPAVNNRNVVMTYLKRLQELLEEDRQQTEQSMPQPQEGEPQPRQGEGDPNENGEPEQQGPGPQEPKENGEQGENPQEPPDDGSGEESEKPDDKSGKKEDEKESEDEPSDPGESPEERARRILKENADLEKGPLTPGRREFNPPEKDW